MDRRKFLKAGVLGGIASTLPVSSAQASEVVEPIPGALGMLYDSTLCVGCQACVAECQNVNHTPVNPKGDQTWSNNDKLTPFTRNIIQVWTMVTVKIRPNRKRLCLRKKTMYALR